MKDWTCFVSMAWLSWRKPSKPSTSTRAGARTASSSATLAVSARTWFSRLRSDIVITPISEARWLSQTAGKVNHPSLDWSRFQRNIVLRWRSNVRAVAIAALAFHADPALAWGDLGHRITAAIAERRLTSSAREELSRLLRSSDLMATPLCPVSTLGDASVWADCVRSLYRPRFSYTARWHYVDVPICGTFDLPRVCPDGQCVVAQLARWRAVLADRSEPPRRRVEALMWVTHLNGDLHQPLHVGDNGDRGGNAVAVSIDGREGRGVNLHSVWDRDLVEKLVQREGGADAFVDHFARSMDPPRAPIAERARESWGAARGLAYPSLPDRVSCGALPTSVEQLGVAYERLAEPVVRWRLGLAGVRLASMLNEALGLGTVNTGDVRR